MQKHEYLEVVAHFQIEGAVKTVKPYGDGLINSTFVVETETNRYILQIKNSQIFQDVPAMMDNIDRVTSHLKQKIVAAQGNPLRETMTLIKTKEGGLYYLDDDGCYWTMLLFIPDTSVYNQVDSLDVAKSGGAGIGKFQSLLSDMPGRLTDILPGFHNMRLRLNQWDNVIAADSAGRKKELTDEIQWIESRRNKMLHFWTLVETGVIPTRITHNDTKISNILFDNQNTNPIVIDLDTVLSSTVLNDFGDAIRSYTNTGLEDDKDLDRVGVNMDIYQAFTAGYLSEARTFLSDSEWTHLAFSAAYITYEQVLRFLMDYIDGDNYYNIQYPTHNLVRTHAQYRLLQDIEAKSGQMQAIIDQYREQGGL